MTKTDTLTESAVRGALRVLTEFGVTLDDDIREQSISHFTRGAGPFECRIVPALGFGGKLRWDRHRGWRVDYYPEDRNSERDQLEARLNAALRRWHPFPVGARVYHAGQQWPGVQERGTATLLEAVPQCDGSYEYRVLVDEAISWPTAGKKTWWASYSTDMAMEPLP